jgi:hypothetical protein
MNINQRQKKAMTIFYVHKLEYKPDISFIVLLPVPEMFGH